jgi:hypothetical protein
MATIDDLDIKSITEMTEQEAHALISKIRSSRREIKAPPPKKVAKKREKTPEEILAKMSNAKKEALIAQLEKELSE